MKPSLDRTLKLLWLAIGALFLLFLVVGGLMVLGQVIGNAGAGSEAERVASGGEPPAEKEAVAVRYGMPDSILGTATRIVRVDGGPPQGRRASYESRYGGYGESETSVNVMFVDEAGVRLLLDRPGFIRDLSYPGAQAKDAPREWISYVVALDDTDRSGKLDAQDAMALYVTDLDGHNLRPVLSPPLRYRSHEAFGPGRILVYALEGTGDDETRLRQRAFLYDTRTNRLAPYAALDTAAERAGRILQR
ncbi:MAG TPA: hypothetical protein VFT45_15845 [Longimicrobium sp.]|nr:hypothetical protein [Longimicrobium sp.]